MITVKFKRDAQVRAAELIEGAGIPVYDGERERIEVTDFGLSNPLVEGAQILTWVQTERIGVKVIALLPHQTLPEHWHPSVENEAGKEETVRHIWGDLIIGVTGEPASADSAADLPREKEIYYTCWHEIVASPGQQVTFAPGEKHWFHAGARGAVAYSFSTVVRDAFDGFTDPGVDRITKVIDDRELQDRQER